jgi:hypothetical protein
MSQVQAGPDKATWKYVAITAVFPLAVVMAVTYTCSSLLHGEVLEDEVMVLDDVNHGVEQENKQKI